MLGEGSQIQKTIHYIIPFNEALEQAKLIYSKIKQITCSMGPKGMGW